MGAAPKLLNRLSEYCQHTSGQAFVELCQTTDACSSVGSTLWLAAIWRGELMTLLDSLDDSIRPFVGKVTVHDKQRVDHARNPKAESQE
jgi:hypothetical protein